MWWHRADATYAVRLPPVIEQADTCLRLAIPRGRENAAPFFSRHDNVDRPMESQRRFHVSLLFPELAAWFLLPCAFLYVYVTQHSAPLIAAFQHLVLLGIVAWCFSLIRLSRITHNWPPRATLALTAGFLALYNFTLAAYYLLVLLGLSAWNNVPSWALLWAYSDQVPPLMNAMGLPVSLLLAVAVLLYLTLFIILWATLSRHDWVRPLASSVQPRHWVLLASGLLLATGISAQQFGQGHWVHDGEPLSLSTFPRQWGFQNHSFDHANIARLDLIEERARAAYSPSEVTDLPNIVVIVVDALRPDHMGIFGYERNTTPYLTRMAHTGKMRSTDRVHAVCAESTCGLLAMAASRYIHGFVRRPITLQEVLRKHGYKAHFILSGDHTNFYGLREVYGEVDTYHDGLKSRDYYINDDSLVIDELSRFPVWDGTPSFFQFHLMSAHPLGHRFHDLRYTPAINYSRPDQHFVDQNRNRTQAIINFYDNGVLQADHVIERIAEILEAKEYLQNAIVVITADHGEALGEHGVLAHAHTVREPVLRIPVITISHGFSPIAAEFQSGFASQVDIAPTILADIGAPPPSTWQGFPLQHNHSEREFTYFQQKSQLGLIDHRDTDKVWKYWIDIQSREEYAFNLVKDRNEQYNLIEGLDDHTRTEWRTAVGAGRHLVTERRKANPIR